MAKKDAKNNISEDRPKWVPKWIPRWVTMKGLIIVTFILLMIFFGNTSYPKILEYIKTSNELRAEIKHYNDSAEYFRQKAHELETNREALERIAREQYGMKREKEDVFITDIP